jgi:hypothetical protein
MFANTINLTIEGEARTFVRVNQDKYSSEYRANFAITGFNGTAKLFHRHSSYVNKDKIQIDRHNVELTYTFVSTTDGHSETRKAYAVFEATPNIAIVSQSDAMVILAGYLNNATCDALANWES